MDAATQKTITYWADNFGQSIAGKRERENFWDSPLALIEQRRIAFPDVREITWKLPSAQLLAERISNPINHAISIGCGSGHKELYFIRSGLVRHFTLVEMVPELIDAARLSFDEAGLGDRVTLICGDYREQKFEHKYGLVYFDNALHHMSDVDNVIADARDLLEVGGYFVMDDFVGPTYNQFSKQLYAYADHVRSLLPSATLESNSGLIPKLGRVSVEEYLATDPSEACDSAEILPSIAARMPGARIIPTGGLVYYLACREAFQSLKHAPVYDATIIRLLFELDRVLVRANPDLTCYALALYRKGAEQAEVDRSIDWRSLIQWPRWQIPL